MHPDGRAALALAAAQVDARRASSGLGQPTLGFAYFSDRYAAQAEALLDELHERWPGTTWVGSAGTGIAAEAAEYLDEPALALMLTDLPREHFTAFGTGQPLPRAGQGWQTALVHADPATPELADLIDELAGRFDSGRIFGGLCASRAGAVGYAGGLWRQGLAGVAFSPRAALQARVSQGCQPIGPTRTVTAHEQHIALRLDDRAAQDCLFDDLGLREAAPREGLLRLRNTLVGLADPDRDEPRTPDRAFGPAVRVRHLIGLDAGRQGVAVGVAEGLREGQQLTFCRRDVDAARRDLLRMGSALREALAEAEPPQRIRGAVYISCTGRGGPHFGGASAELQWLQHALGASAAEPLPVVGCFAAGEIAHREVHTYSGVLLVFTGPA